MLSIAEKLERYEPEPNSGCWLWTGELNNKGYGTFTHGRGVRWLAHRASYIEANGPIAEGVCVLHKCDTPACMNPQHLFAGTLYDNWHDMFQKGRWAGSGWPRRKGTQHTHAKLTESVVAAMRDRSRAGETHEEIAQAFGFKRQTVSLSISGKTWAHVPNPVPSRRASPSSRA